MDIETDLGLEFVLPVLESISSSSSSFSSSWLWASPMSTALDSHSQSDNVAQAGPASCVQYYQSVHYYSYYG
eukprot:3004167-Amphidinium_carterae.1